MGFWSFVVRTIRTTTSKIISGTKMVVNGIVEGTRTVVNYVVEGVNNLTNYVVDSTITPFNNFINKLKIWFKKFCTTIIFPIANYIINDLNIFYQFFQNIFSNVLQYLTNMVAFMQVILTFLMGYFTFPVQFHEFFHVTLPLFGSNIRNFVLRNNLLIQIPLIYISWILLSVLYNNHIHENRINHRIDDFDDNEQNEFFRRVFRHDVYNRYL